MFENTTETFDKLADKGKERYKAFCNTLKVQPSPISAAEFISSARNDDGTFLYADVPVVAVEKLALLLSLRAS